MPVIGGPPPATPGIGTPVYIVYSAIEGAYPPRPAGLPAGLGVWKGPAVPTDADGALDLDDWKDTS